MLMKLRKSNETRIWNLKKVKNEMIARSESYSLMSIYYRRNLIMKNTYHDSWHYKTINWWMIKKRFRIRLILHESHQTKMSSTLMKHMESEIWDSTQSLQDWQTKQTRLKYRRIWPNLRKRQMMWKLKHGILYVHRLHSQVHMLLQVSYLSEYRCQQTLYQIHE